MNAWMRTEPASCANLVVDPGRADRGIDVDRRNGVTHLMPQASDARCDRLIPGPETMLTTVARNRTSQERHPRR